MDHLPIYRSTASRSRASSIPWRRTASIATAAAALTVSGIALGYQGLAPAAPGNVVVTSQRGPSIAIPGFSVGFSDGGHPDLVTAVSTALMTHVPTSPSLAQVLAAGPLGPLFGPQPVAQVVEQPTPVTFTVEPVNLPADAIVQDAPTDEVAVAGVSLGQAIASASASAPAPAADAVVEASPPPSLSFTALEAGAGVVDDGSSQIAAAQDTSADQPADAAPEQAAASAPAAVEAASPAQHAAVAAPAPVVATATPVRKPVVVVAKPTAVPEDEKPAAPEIIIVREPQPQRVAPAVEEPAPKREETSPAKAPANDKSPKPAPKDKPAPKHGG